MNASSTSHVVLLTLAFWLAGCATQTDAIAPWVGAPVAELRKAWGAPSYTVYIDRDRTRWVWPGYYQHQNFREPVQHHCFFTAYVDRMGLIYRMEHSDCPNNVMTPDQAGFPLGR